MKDERPPLLTPVSLDNLADCEASPAHAVIDPIMYRGFVTLLSSHGGAGKTVLAETLAAHIAAGKIWAGLSVERGHGLFVSLEDRGDLARYRLRRVCDAYGLDPASIAENVTILDGSATDTSLAVEVNESGVRRLAFTRVLEEIERAASRGVAIVVIDNASDAFAGNENDRQQVRAFVRRLGQLAQKYDCAVLLLAHIDKAAAKYGSSGNTYSGSTAWHNTSRSRLALIEDDGGILLVQEKNNLGRKIEPIRLEWSDLGVLVPVATTGSAALERDEQDDSDVLAAIKAAIRDGATVHAARSGSHTPLAVLMRYPDLPAHLRKDRSRFWATLTRLERTGVLVRESYKNSHRHDRERLNVCADSCAPHSPHTPQRTDAHMGRVDAPVLRQSNRRGTDALTQKACPSCDGAGCKWCLS